MASDFFLEIDGIKGESRDAKHKDALDIDSYSWGLSQAGSATGGGGAGKAVFQDIHFMTRLSKASPKLFLACATGEHISKAVLFARKAGREQQEYYTIQMSDVVVSSFQQSGSAGGDVPTDTFSLSFARLDLEYREQADDGSLGESHSAGWDLKQNTKF